MTWRDTIEMAIHNLLQRRGRSALNLLGVVVGCTMLLMATAGGQGVLVAIESLFERSEFARQIHVTPNYQFGQAEVPEGAIQIDGKMSQDRHDRIYKILEREWKSEHRARKTFELDSKQLDVLEQMPHVSEVIPRSWVTGVLSLGEASCFGGVEGTSLIGDLKNRIVAGRLPAMGKHEEALIDDITAWRLGFVDDRDLDKLVGRQVTLTIQNSNSAAMALVRMLGRNSGFEPEQFLKQMRVGEAMKALIDELDSTSLTDDQKTLIREAVTSFTAAAKSELMPEPDVKDEPMAAAAVTRTFTICGVYKPASDQDIWKLFRQMITGARSGLLVSPHAIRKLLEDSGSLPDTHDAIVTVDSPQHLKTITTEMEAIGLRAHSAVKILERMDRSIDQSLLVIYGIAAVVLLTTSIGICTTLLVSILERTPEIGIMKSLGAEDRHIRRLMLCEGAGLGAVGAAISVSLSWLLGKIGDGFLRSHVESQVNENLNDGLFHFGVIPIILVTLLAITICIVASLIPAIRASRLDPVVAMRRQ